MNGSQNVTTSSLKIQYDAARTTQTLALGGRHNQEDNLSLHPAFIRKPARGNGYGHGCHPSLSGTQEHYHHADLFQDGGTADVRGRGQDNPETQGSVRRFKIHDIQRERLLFGALTVPFILVGT